MFGQRMNATAVITLLCGAWTSTVIAATPYIFVNGQCGNDAWSGKYSQCSAPDGYKRTIQAALDAIPDGGVVAVTDGIYGGDGNRDLDFKGKAVRLVCANGPDACTIDCGGTRTENHRAFHFHTGEDSNSIVQGFTVTNGVAYKGGAVLCSNSSPKFVNCIFRNNEATDDDTGGGAMYNENSSPVLEGCTFTGNIAMPSASFGGAISNKASSPTLTDCIFINNNAWCGGGIYNTNSSNPVLQNCAFLNNQATMGAAMGNRQSTPQLRRCTFTGNSASYYGGAMNNSFSSNPTLTHCTFMSNSASDGGGIANWNSSPAAINCLFAANSATHLGGAVSNDTSFTQLSNCTIYGNSASYGGGIASFDDSRVTTTNCIVWGNAPTQVYNDDPACNQIRYSCVEGGWPGTGNISGNPLFADPDGPDDIPGTEDDNTRLAAGSPCIDSGDPEYTPAPGETDLDGNPRIINGTVDLGTYENQGGAPPTDIIYVDDSAAGANNGSSWANAFKYLQDALAAAGECEIRVAQGTYKPDQGAGVARYDREATFQLRNNVTIKGGYAGLGEPAPDTRDIEQYPTILTGDLAGDDGPDFANYSENSFHVVTGTDTDATAVLDGVTITAGNADAYPHNNGGGIHIEMPGSPTFVDCTISYNHAEHGGGGLELNGYSAAVAMTRCIFVGNTAGYAGGAIYNYKGDETLLYLCTFRANSAARGGAVNNYLGSMTVTNCIFTGNAADDYSGGRGGALHHWGSSTSDYFILLNSTITGNSALGIGGPGQGGGLVVQDEMARIDNCIFWNNSDADDQDESAQIHDIGGESVLFNCCVQGFSGGGTGNIADDPLLVNPDGPDNIFGTEDDNVRLLAGSPCIDAGNNHAVSEPFTKDMDGNPRIENGTVDIGAYEGASPGIIVEPQFITVPEGRIVSFTVRLSTDPHGPIEVTLTHSGDTDIELETGPHLYFDSSNYHLPQPVELIGASDPDSINGSAMIYLTAPGFFPAGVTATELDSQLSTVLYVDASAPAPGTGSSWATAFLNLQDALSAAIEYPQFNEIRVAQGTYKPDRGTGVTPGSRDATFQLINNVAVKGGYAGLAGADPDVRDSSLYKTVLSGDLEGDDAKVGDPADLLEEPTHAENSRNVVTAANCGRTAVIDGFTITGGNANGPAEAQKYGGGIYGGMPTISNCTIVGNSANIGGGAIYSSGPYYDAQGLITTCSIIHNAAPTGGGIYGCPVLANCIVNANAATAYSGGGVYLGQGCDTTVTDCTFINNSAVTYGGGVMLGVSESTPIFTRCAFIANSAGGSGGAVASDGCTCGSYPEFYQCIFTANSADTSGGAVYSFGYSLPKLFSCLLTGNHSGANGGAFSHGWGAGSYLVNCTITHNTAAERTGGILYEDSYSYLEKVVANCIIWGNSAGISQTLQDQQIFALGTASMPSVDYSCIQGWTGGSVGNNIALDPQFVDADGPDNIPGNQDDNLRLEHDSPCINRGSNEYVAADSNDLDGKSRIFDGTVDMGAYESSSPAEWTRYDLIDLGTLGGSRSEARAINNYRQIVGWAVNESGRERATLFDYTGAGNNIGLGTLGGNMSEAYSINIHGDVVGKALADATSYFHAALFDTADPCDNIGLEGPANDSSEAHSINDHGQIVGTVRFPNSDWKATLFDPSDPDNNIDLSGDLSNRAGSDDSCALSINNKGQIVGYAHTGETSVIDRPYMFDPTGAGNNIRLTPNNSPGVAYCINDAGQIVGSSWQTNGAGLFNPEDPNLNLSLGALPEATGSVAYSINNRGQIVGSVTFEDSIQDSFYNAVIFDPTGSGDNRNLNDLVDNALGWELNVASGINDAGWIVGYGTNPHGQRRAFLLVPKGQSPALIAHWKLDESEGDTAEDSAGDNDGTLHGGPQWQLYSGRLEGALLFDGENDYVNCGSDSAFDITGQITVAAWANFNSVNMEWQTVIAKGDSAWRLSTASNYRRYHFAVTGGPPWNYINGDIEVAANEWHHVCGTYDGANLRLYIDGVEDPAGPVPELNGVTTDDYDVYIGENQERPGRYWDGLIDDVRVYNYALSPAQVFNLCKPGVLYVDADAPGANNGSSWANAFKCLQDALAAAADGTEIRVAQGTYRPDRGAGITPGDRQAAFGLQNGVTIKGGYAGHGEPEPDARSITQYPTILSGDLLGNDGPEQANRIDNSRHVVTASTTNTTAVLDGVAITAGYADGIDSDYPFINNGAGMYNKNGSPTLIDCTFTQNIVVLYDHEYGGLGAAIYNLHSNPVIRNCTFRQNSASGGHGAVCNETSSPMISDCTFEDNDGGGIEFRYETSGTVTGCSFIGNTTAYGAGVNCEYGSSPSISDCTFVGNIAWYDGGALRCYVNCTPVVTNCIFAGNKTTIQNGGAICALESSPVFANCTFIGNSANRNGGAIHCYRTSHPKVANSILWGNSAPDGSQISLTYYQHPGEDPSATEITLSYCDIQGGFEGIFLEEMCCANWGPGNIVVDPCFVSPGYWDSNATPGDAGDDSWVNGDYHLKSFGWRWDAAYEEWTFDRVTSRCIDAGNPGSPLAEEPLTIPDDPDNEYGQNVRINMGAYGGTAQASMPPYDWALLADINNDGIADFCDFAYAGLCWALTAPEQPCDLNRSGDVNPADLDLFADDWLKTTIWRK